MKAVCGEVMRMFLVSFWIICDLFGLTRKTKTPAFMLDEMDTRPALAKKIANAKLQFCYGYRSVQK